MASKFGVTVPKSAHTRIFSLHTRDINKTRETREHDQLTSPKVNLCANRRIAARKRERERERENRHEYSKFEYSKTNSLKRKNGLTEYKQLIENIKN